MSNKTFPTGLFCKRRDNSPDFVLCDVSIKASEFYEFLRSHKNDAGYVNLQILKSKDGKPYAVLNDWKPPDNTNNSFRSEVDNQAEKGCSKPFKMFDGGHREDDIPF